ncbi:hypothetical protein BDZ85DRAFT_261516 [Elsinoe ampelina]|uniref:Uncharacterized protein n=1 Tax=Elsinoe ampelina TaxID=302913 RepID=A0A6A6GDC8_9PEZI|nr:hypothetical protein BDZ85DRAFT_261516 [Elsinoe ampelina]
MGWALGGPPESRPHLPSKKYRHPPQHVDIDLYGFTQHPKSMPPHATQSGHSGN